MPTKANYQGLCDVYKIWLNPALCTMDDKKKIKWREDAKKQYWTRKKKGLCTKCGKRSPTPGMVRCPVCAVQQNHYSRQHYITNRQDYLKREKKRQERHRKNRECLLCGKPLADEDNGHVLCVNHRNKLYMETGAPNYALAYKTVARKS